MKVTTHISAVVGRLQFGIDRIRSDNFFSVAISI